MNESLYIIVRHRGNEYLVEIDDPTEPLKSIVNKLVGLLGIERRDRNGTPLYHYLERKVGVEEELLQPQVDGEDKSLLDYNVKSEDMFFIRTFSVGSVHGVYSTHIKKYGITWMDLIELKNVYAWLGVLLGLPIAAYGVYLILMGLTAETAYKTLVVGNKIIITNAFPGIVLFFAGLLIVWVTKYSWEKHKFQRNKFLPL